MSVLLIAAVAENGVIGADGELPWHLPDDLRHFKELTMGAAVVMGRVTAQSLGWRPLPGRSNIVVTSRNEAHAGFVNTGSLDEALRMADNTNRRTFIIGGAGVYGAALAADPPLPDFLYITQVHASPEGDTYFPRIDPEAYRQVADQSEHHPAGDGNGHAFTFTVWQRNK